MKPEEARGILPLDTKTELVMTANIREWRHVIRLRTSPGAQKQIRDLIKLLTEEFKKELSILFEDLL